MNILVLTELNHGKYAVTHGICCNAIATELIKMGHSIHFLQEKVYGNEPDEEMIDGFTIHRIPRTFHRKLSVCSAESNRSIKGKVSRIFLRIISAQVVLLYPWYPLRRPLLTFKVMRKAKKLHESVGFDMTFCSYYPMSALYAGEYLKKKCGVPFVSYLLESFTNITGNRFLLSKTFMNNQGLKYEKRFFSASDLILNLKCHEEHFQNSDYSAFSHKMQITDIPYLKDRTRSTHSERSKNHINLVYTGGVKRHLVQTVISFFSEINDVTFHVYGPNNNAFPDCRFIVKHGKVSYKDALYAQDTADILVSMGNAEDTYNFIPSKIFDYISTGKKIVHFHHTNNDVSISYYKKYANCCLVNTSDDYKKNLDKLREFLSSNEEVIEWNELEKLFPMNKAQYTAELVEELFLANPGFRKRNVDICS